MYYKLIHKKPTIMGLFKEHANTFETIERKQSQIYNDACDCGVAYNTNKIPSEVFLALHFAKDLARKPFLQKREEWKNGVTITIQIGWEIDAGMECGTEYTISYNKMEGSGHSTRINKSANAFICVHSKSYRKPL